MINDEIKFIKNDYKQEATEEQKEAKKELIHNIIFVLFKCIVYSLTGLLWVCIAIFMIIIYAPLYMFFGVKPCKIKRRKWRW